MKTPKKLILLDILSGLCVIVALLMILFYAPLEIVMGAVQKVFYFHVSSAWVGMLSFILAAVMAVFYLRTKQMKWDVVSVATIEIGMVFVFVSIVSGSIWAKPAWNTWWTWEPRLTSVTILELLYAAYFILRQGVDDPERKARFGSVYAIISSVAVPMTFVSIRLYRTIHPVLIASGDSSASSSFEMTSSMLQTLLFSLFAFSMLFAALLWHRIRLENRKRRIEQIKAVDSY